MSDEGYLVDSERPSLQLESKLVRRPERGYRTLVRSRSRAPQRERYPRQHKESSLEQLLGRLVADHGLTDAIRERCVLVFWREIAGDRIGERTQPQGISAGVLKLAARTSAQVHELQFFKTQLIEKINAWIFANHVWLGAAPIVSEIKVTLGTVRPAETTPHARQQQRQLARLRPRGEATGAEREEILQATCTVEDPELRSLIERVRLSWNR